MNRSLKQLLSSVWSLESDWKSSKNVVAMARVCLRHLYSQRYGVRDHIISGYRIPPNCVCASRARVFFFFLLLFILADTVTTRLVGWKSAGRVLLHISKSGGNDQWPRLYFLEFIIIIIVSLPVHCIAAHTRNKLTHSAGTRWHLYLHFGVVFCIRFSTDRIYPSTTVVRV